MKIFPRKMNELNSITTLRAIRALIVDSQADCTNIYSPKYKELTKLYDWVNKNIPDKRLHCKQSLDF